MSVQFRQDRVREAVQSRWILSEQFRSWLLRRRWFAQQSPEGLQLELVDTFPFSSPPDSLLVTLLLEAGPPGSRELYHVPLRLTATEPKGVDRFLATLANQRVYGCEAEGSQHYCRELGKLATTRARGQTDRGRRLVFETNSLIPMQSSRVISSEETRHVLILLEAPPSRLLLKSYKRLDTADREARLLEHLTKRGYGGCPRYFGGVYLFEEGHRTALSIFLEFLEGVENVFDRLVSSLTARVLAVPLQMGEDLEIADALGRALAELHQSLTDPSDALFAPEAIDRRDLEATRALCGRYLRDIQLRVTNLRDTLEAQRMGVVAREVEALGEALPSRLDALDHVVGLSKIQTHQDLHLAQVVRRPDDGHIFFIDFEGQLGRSPGERWRKASPLRDLATLARSFGYVKHYALRAAAPDPEALWSRAFLASETRAPQVAALDAWEDAMVRAVERAYLESLGSLRRSSVPESPDATRSVVKAYMVEKALYEAGFELSRRPPNVLIPLEGLRRLLGPEG
jgi:maltose alpha-D-glucosyltransferase/alpha-amylase